MVKNESKFILRGARYYIRSNPGKVAPNSKGTVSFNYMMPFGKQDDVIIYLDVYVNDKKLPEPLQIKVLNENKLGKG